MTTAAEMESHAKRVSDERSVSEFMGHRDSRIPGLVPALPQKAWRLVVEGGKGRVERKVVVSDR